MPSRLTISLVFASILVVACDSPPPSGAKAPALAAPPPAPELPKLVVATRSMRIGSMTDPKDRWARPTEGLPLEIVSIDGDHAIVRTKRGAVLEGMTTAKSLGVMMCAATPIGDRWLAGNHDVLSLRSFVKNGRVDVAGTVTLRQNKYVEGVPFDREFTTLRFEGSVSIASLCTSPIPQHAGTDDDPIVGTVLGENDDEGFAPSTPEVSIDKGRAVTLLDAPGGSPVYARPADDWGYSLKVIETKAGWMRVAAGGGPYLLGWMPAEPVHVPQAARDTNMLAAIGGVGPLDLMTGDLAKEPLYELPIGAVIAGPGNLAARITKAGYVRVSSEHDASGRARVHASISQDMTLEGWMDPAKLGPLVEQKPR